MARVLATLAITIGLLAAAVAGSAGADTPDRIVAAFGAWMKEYGVSKGAMVVFQDGTPVREHSAGLDVAAPVELASLSKAITGACVADLVRTGKLAYADTLTARLDWSGALGKITVAQLLTHTSGLRDDVTQKLMRKWLGKPDPRWAAVGEVVERSGEVGSKAYFYSNVNYALLALVIEQASGQDYVTACTPVIKAFPSAGLSPVTGGFAPWGGWTMTLQDYGRFILTVVKPGLTRAPVATLGGGANYGPGILWRRSGSGVNAWHFGLHCFPGRFEAGSFVASWNGPWTVTVAYRGCLTDAARDGLDMALATAALGG